MSQAELAAVAEADVLVPTVTDRIGSRYCRRRETTKLIASFGTGIDHIDFAAAKKRNITVTNTPGVLTEDTAMTMALILAVPRRLSKAKEWSVPKNGTLGTDAQLSTSNLGKTLGIVGMGRIDKPLRIGRGFGLYSLS